MGVNINEIIDLIPEDPIDEALLAVETVTTFPADNAARVRCHLSREFRLMIQLSPAGVTLSAEGRAPVLCSPDRFLPTLRRTIHEIDEALAAGTYRPSEPKPNYIISPPPPPADMDIPIWDEQTGTYYDAEY